MSDQTIPSRRAELLARLDDVVFDGPPGAEPGRFVEVEDAAGRGISAGRWIERGDGYWVLRLDVLDA